MTLLIGWLLMGAIVACINDRYVVRDHTDGLGERLLYLVRVMLAWPTYLAEDFLMWGKDVD